MHAGNGRNEFRRCDALSAGLTAAASSVVKITVFMGALKGTQPRRGVKCTVARPKPPLARRGRNQIFPGFVVTSRGSGGASPYRAYR